MARREKSERFYKILLCIFLGGDRANKIFATLPLVN